MLTFFIALAAQPTAGSGTLSEARMDRLQTPAFRACMSRGEARRGVTVAMLDCIDDEIRRQDELLNARYRRIMARLPGGRRDRLRRLQRAWIVERDRRCARVGGDAGAGTAAALAAQECFLGATVARSEWLRSRYLA